MTSFSFAPGGGAVQRPIDDYGRRNSVTSILRQYAVPLAAFIFAFSIARIGMFILPGTTNLSWALAYVCVVPFIVSRPNLYLAIARRNVVFIIAGVFATTSSLWSLMPSLSAYFGLLFLLNLVVGAVIAERIGIVPVMLFVFWFCLVIQTASLLLFFAHAGTVVDDSANFRGLYSTKNVLAMHACILYLTSLLLLLAKWRSLLSLCGIGISVVCVVLSRSGTGIIMFTLMTAIALSCYLVAQRRRWTLGVVGAFLIVFSIVSVIIINTGYDLSGGILAAIGKDSTFTGRTVLWEKAIESFETRPWFGLGYQSYWYSPETDASEIWILTGQQLRSFHNIYLDRLVDVGIVGLALFLAGFIAVLIRSLRLLLAERTVTWAWCFTFLIFLAALGLSEYPFFWNSEFQLLISIIAVATSKIRSEGASA